VIGSQIGSVAVCDQARPRLLLCYCWPGPSPTSSVGSSRRSARDRDAWARQQRGPRRCLQLRVLFFLVSTLVDPNGGGGFGLALVLLLWVSVVVRGAMFITCWIAVEDGVPDGPAEG
jgi:hypothetical protein